MISKNYCKLNFSLIFNIYLKIKVLGIAFTFLKKRIKKFQEYILGLKYSQEWQIFFESKYVFSKITVTLVFIVLSKTLYKIFWMSLLLKKNIKKMFESILGPKT